MECESNFNYQDDQPNINPFYPNYQEKPNNPFSANCNHVTQEGFLAYPDERPMNSNLESTNNTTTMETDQTAIDQRVPMMGNYRKDFIRHFITFPLEKCDRREESEDRYYKDIPQPDSTNNSDGIYQFEKRIKKRKLKEPEERKTVEPLGKRELFSLNSPKMAQLSDFQHTETDNQSTGETSDELSFISNSSEHYESSRTEEKHLLQNTIFSEESSQAEKCMQKKDEPEKPANKTIKKEDIHFIVLVPVEAKGDEKSCEGKSCEIPDDQEDKTLQYRINHKLKGFVRSEPTTRPEGKPGKVSKTLTLWLKMFKKTAFSKEHKDLLYKTTIFFGLNRPRSLREERNCILEDEMNATVENDFGIDCKMLGFFWDYPWVERAEENSKREFKNLDQNQDFMMRYRKDIQKLSEPEKTKYIAHEDRTLRQYIRKMIPYGQILDRIKDSQEVQDTVKAINAENPDAVIIYCIGHAEINSFNKSLSQCVKKILEDQSRSSQVISFGYIYPHALKEENERQHYFYAGSQLDRLSRIEVNRILPGGVYFPEPGLFFTLGKEHKTIPNFSTSQKRGSGESTRFLRNLKPEHFFFGSSSPIELKVRERVAKCKSNNYQFSQSHRKRMFFAKYLFINFTQTKAKFFLNKRTRAISRVMKKYDSAIEELLESSVEDQKTNIYYLKKLQGTEPDEAEIKELIRSTDFTKALNIFKALYNSALSSLLYLLAERNSKQLRKLIRKKTFDKALPKVFRGIIRQSSESLPSDYSSFQEIHHQRIQEKFNEVRRIMIAGDTNMYDKNEKEKSEDSRNLIAEDDDDDNLQRRNIKTIICNSEKDCKLLIGHNLLCNDIPDVLGLCKLYT